jgi:hypothetical protein
VEHLFEMTEARRLDKERLQQEIVEAEQAAEEKKRKMERHKLQVVKALANESTLHVDSTLHRMADRARVSEAHKVEEPKSHSEEQAKKDRAARLKLFLDGAEIFHHGDQPVPDVDKIRGIGGKVRHEVQAIPHVALTEMQSEMLESSLIRSADEHQRKLHAAEVHKQQEVARLFRLKLAQKDDMAAEELRKERAEERRIERERQTNPKTAAEGEHFDFVQDVRQVLVLFTLFWCLVA